VPSSQTSSHQHHNQRTHQNSDGHSNGHKNSAWNKKRVAFLPTTTTSTSSTDAGSTAMTNGHRVQSPSIAIHKKNRNQLRPSTASTASTASTGSEYQEDSDYDGGIEFSYNEKLYDSATWRMYHRIIDHRRNQQCLSYGFNEKKHQPQQLHQGPYHHHTIPNGMNGGSGNMRMLVDLSSSSSSNPRLEDDDDIFELEL
jgi:hypothetical protein